MEPGRYDPAVESKKLRDDSKDGNREETESEQDVGQLSLSKRSDEVGPEQKRAVIDTVSLPSSHTLHQFHPSISAQNSGVAVAPNVSDCKIENFIFTVNQGNVSHDAPSQPKKVEILKYQQQLKDTLRRKYSHLLEGMQKPKRAPLDEIYTKLHIITGGNGKVIKEHEVRPMETDTSCDLTEEEPIDCNELFNPPEGRVSHVRTVITKGVANIGKTVATYKFILDWAEGRENTNLDFVFPVPFRDLNLMWKKPYSLVQLLDDLFPELKGSEIFTLGEHKMLFIFDGLNESQMPLDFDNSEIVSDMTKPSTVADLLINIIRERLLPSALVWITSRPVASSQIPLEYIHLEIEVQGFNDPQKDEYFRKKIMDQDRAERVITHVKSSRSIHIMCRIPAFCLLCALALEQKLAKMGGEDTPLTLTPMYIQYLIGDVGSMTRKLPGPHSAPNRVRTDIISLGKLAFEELNEDRSFFYESDLTKNNIQVTEPSTLSGFYTQIFSEELILCPERMFSFVHLSVQEFFAALYVYHKVNNDNVNVLIKSASAESEDVSELNLFKAAVEMSLQRENGHFDIFLRFLLGLSLESNQKSLKPLIPNKTNQKTRDEIIKYIEERIRSSPSPDRCCNLRLCLNELGDYSIGKKI